jgi:hypothetical protein
MPQYKCDKCGQPAAIESGGAIVSRHHCEEHGANVLYGAARIDGTQSEFATATCAIARIHRRASFLTATLVGH